MEKISIYIDRNVKRVFFGSVFKNHSCLLDVTDIIDKKFFAEELKYNWWGWKDISIPNPQYYKVMRAYKEAMERMLSELVFHEYIHSEALNYEYMIAFEIKDKGRISLITIHSPDPDHLKELRDFILTKPNTIQLWLMRQENKKD